MAGFFRSLKRLATGEVLKRVDTKVVNGMQTISLRLKREKSSDVKYVVLALTAGGNYQYTMLEMDEFDRFLQAAEDIKIAAVTPPPASGS
jgi:hypothetical protein